MSTNIQLLTDRLRRLSLDVIRERGIPISIEEFRRTNIVPPTHAAPVLRALAERGDLVLVSGDRYQLASHHERDAMRGSNEVHVGKSTTIVNVLDPAEIVAAMPIETSYGGLANMSAAIKSNPFEVIASAGTKKPRRATALDADGRKPCRKCHRNLGPEYFVRDGSMRPDKRVALCAYCVGILAADQEIEVEAQPHLAPDAPDKTRLPRERASLTMRRWKDKGGHSLTVTIQWRDAERLARLEQRLRARGSAQPLEMRHYTHLIAHLAHGCAAFADSLAEGVEPGHLTIALFDALLDDEPVVP